MFAVLSAVDEFGTDLQTGYLDLKVGVMPLGIAGLVPLADIRSDPYLDSVESKKARRSLRERAQSSENRIETAKGRGRASHNRAPVRLQRRPYPTSICK